MTEPTKRYEKRDIRQEATNKIISMLEGGTSFWEKPWKGAGRHHNPVSGTTYSGGNAFALLHEAAAQGYPDPRWVTMRQIMQLNVIALRDQGIDVEMRAKDGGKSVWPYNKETGKAIKFEDWPVKLKAGSKGVSIEFWKRVEDKDKSGARAEEGEQDEQRAGKSRMTVSLSTVFNASCVTGMPPMPERTNEFSDHELVEKLTDLLQVKVANVENDRACYSPSRDAIEMPPKEVFRTRDGYYSTLLHEQAHWAMVPSRLNLGSPDYHTSDAGRAKEELRAELSSVFAAAELGLTLDMSNHASYVGSWAQALKNDKHEIYRAASDASKVVDFLLQPLRDRGLLKAPELIDLGDYNKDAPEKAMVPAKKERQAEKVGQER